MLADDRQAHRADRALPGVERAPRAARPPRPGVHARLHGDAGGARAQPRRARLPDAERAARARLISAHRPTVPIYALSPGPRDRAPLRADVGRPGGVDAPLRGHRGADRGGRASASSSSAGASPATASGSPPACRRASRARRACCRSKRCEAHVVPPRRSRRDRRGPDHARVPALGAAAGEGGLAAADADRRARGRQRRGRRARSDRRGRARRRLRERGGRARPRSRTRRRDFTASRCTSRARTRGSRCARRRPTTRVFARAGADGRVDLRVPAARSREHPAVRAADLAESFGRERLDFKRDVRKLKELGLTESLEIGYRSRRAGLSAARLCNVASSGRQADVLSSRPNARWNTSPWRSVAQRAIVTSSVACRRSSTVPLSTSTSQARTAWSRERSSCSARRTVGRDAVEQVAVALARDADELAEARVALAVVAGGLADQRDSRGREARHAGVEDQVARVLVVVVVVDRDADVVQHRGRPQQLALLRVAAVQAGRGERVPHLEREPGDVLGVREVGVVLGGEVAHGRRGGRRSTSARVAEQRLEEHALAQARPRSPRQPRSRRPPSRRRSRARRRGSGRRARP